MTEIGERLSNPDVKKSPWEAVFSVLVVLLVLLAAFRIYFNSAYFRVEVSGNSMYDTLSDGDVFFAQKTDRVRRGDIVVVDVRGYGDLFIGEYIIKRVIATGGDCLYAEEGVVYIRYAGKEEFVPLREDYLLEERSTEDFSMVTVGDGEIFVMGDNRRDSKDSRAVGCLKEKEVQGTVPDWAYRNRAAIKAWYGLWAFH